MKHVGFHSAGERGAHPSGPQLRSQMDLLTLSRLSKLSINVANDVQERQASIKLLRHLIVPALREFAFTTKFHQDEALLHIFNLLRTARTDIERLEVNLNRSLSDSDVSHLQLMLEGAPKLKLLKLRESRWKTAFLSTSPPVFRRCTLYSLYRPEEAFQENLTRWRRR